MSSEAQKMGFGKLLMLKSIKYGMMGNVLLVFGIVIFYFLFDNVITNTKNLALLIALVFMFFSVKEFRSDNANEMMFWQGVFVGLFTFLVFAGVSGTIIYLYTKVVDHQALNTYIEYKLASLEQYKEVVGDKKYEDYLEQTINLKPLGVAMDHLFTLLYVGVFGSAIVAALLRKVPNAV